jgi:hypothetical protein
MVRSDSRPDTDSTKRNKILPFVSDNQESERDIEHGSEHKHGDEIESDHECENGPEHEHEPEPEKDTYIGDTLVLNDESKRANNNVNTSIFMMMLGFVAFLTLFCCIYTYHIYTQSVILWCWLMIVVSCLIEVLFLRPFTCFILTLITMIKRKVRSKEIMMREIEEVKEVLDLKDPVADSASDKNIGQLSEERSKSHDLEENQDR